MDLNVIEQGEDMHTGGESTAEQWCTIFCPACYIQSFV